VDNIGRIGLVKIVSESSVASGVRRIEAVTGKAAEQLLWKEYRELQQIRNLLKARGDEEVSERIIELMDEKNELEKQLQEIKNSALLNTLAAELASSPEIGGCRVMIKSVEGADGDTLRQVGLALRERMPFAAGLLCSVEDGKVSLVGFASDRAVRELGLDAAKLVREAAQHVKGGGGGKPEFATAGGKNPAGIDMACEAFAASVKAALKG